MSFIHRFATGLIDPSQTNLPNTTTSIATSDKIQEILSIVFGIAGAVSVLIIVIAGLQMVISAGESAKVAKARQSILYAIIGLVVCLSAFVLVRFVIGRVG